MQGNLDPKCLSERKQKQANYQFIHLFSAGQWGNSENELASIKRIDVQIFLVPVESLW